MKSRSGGVSGIGGSCCLTLSNVYALSVYRRALAAYTAAAISVALAPARIFSAAASAPSPVHELSRTCNIFMLRSLASWCASTTLLALVAASCHFDESPSWIRRTNSCSGTIPLLAMMSFRFFWRVFPTPSNSPIVTPPPGPSDSPQRSQRSSRQAHTSRSRLLLFQNSGSPWPISRSHRPTPPPRHTWERLRCPCRPPRENDRPDPPHGRSHSVA